MKKYLLLLLLPFLFFAACSFFNDDETGDFAFTLDEAFIDSVKNNSRETAEMAGYGGGDDLTITVFLSGGFEDKRSVTGNIDTLSGKVIKFDAVPLNVSIDITVNVYKNLDDLIYSGSIKDVVLTDSDGTQLTIDVSKLLNTDYALLGYKTSSEIGLYRVENVNGPYSVTVGQVEPKDYCFNKNGDLVYLTDAAVCINSNVNSISGIGGANRICCDYSNNDLYGVNSDYEITKYVFQDGSYVFDAMSESFASTFEIPDELYELYDEYDIAANNEKIYYGFTEYDADYNPKTKIYEFVYNRTEGEDGGVINISTDARIIEINDYAASIKDMICQENYLFVLLGAGLNDFDRYDSRGCIAKINLSSFTLEKVSGWTAGKTITGEYNVPYLYPVDRDNGISRYIYDTETQKLVSNPLGSTSPGRGYTLNAPINTPLNQCLIGPRKFIAVKPKKLVIADSGLWFYTDGDDVLFFKNINRVVYVDLESLAITSSTDIELRFDEESITRLANMSTVDVIKNIDIEESGKYYYINNGEIVDIEPSDEQYPPKPAVRIGLADDSEIHD